MIRTELRLRIPNSPGALAEVIAALAADRVRILALALESSGLARMIVDNPLRAVGVLRDRHLPVVQADVIYTVVARQDIAALLTSVARSGVNLEHVYTAPETDVTTGIVLGVHDAERAAARAGL